MPQTPNAAMNEAFVTALAQRTLVALRENPKIASMMTNVDQVDKGRSFTRGNTCNIVLDPIFTASNAQDGTGKTYQTPTQTKISITLDHFREVPAVYTDLDTVIANPNLTIQQYAPAMANAAAEDMEKTIIEEVLNDPDIPATDEIGAVGTDMNEDTFLELDQRFAEKGVSDSEQRIVFLTPKHYRQALKIARLTQMDTSGKGNVIVTGKLRDAFGMTIYRSNYMPALSDLANVTGSTADKVSMAFTKQSLLLAARPLTQQTLGNGVTKRTVQKDGYSLRARAYEIPDKNQYCMVVDYLYGTKVVKRPSASGELTTVFPILGGVS